MHGNEILKQATNFNRSQSNLLVVVVLTAINLFLFITGSDMQFLFSASIPTVILVVADSFSWMMGEPSIWYGGIALAFGSVGIYLLCWWLSKKRRVFILVALIFFSIDALVFLFFFFDSLMYGFFDLFDIIEIAIYAIIMYHLIIGTVAWAKMKKMEPEDFAATRAAWKNLKQNNDNEEE